MDAIATDLIDESIEARRRVESCCQALVEGGRARWRFDDDGNAELHMDSGEVFRFGERGVTRRK